MSEAAPRERVARCITSGLRASLNQPFVQPTANVWKQLVAAGIVSRFFAAQLTALGDPLHEPETFRRSLIAPLTQLRQTQWQTIISAA
ncbi:hypothetical protein BMG00_00230 [Thioclava marina]|uniref:Uncharacterized protein n=1 Tax=Thioclava marina TaxID=1915077 RepID=A0ABX3MLN7_9RHOB|nr:hypothetical protein [Thioclava marina]OOY12335.1 hypothetical protein BMG00_00230 [Thioclava marina]